MKPYLSILLLLYSSFIFAQTPDDVPPFGQVDKNDLLMKECSFDKNAEAVALFDAEEVHCKEYTFSVYTEIYRHIRIKLLKDKGLDEANIHIRYISRNNTESISNIEAQTYNLDANGNIVVTKLDKKSVFEKSINKRYSEKVFTFPEAKVGSIIEYSYKVDATVGGGLRNWYFQKAIPVKLSRFTIDFPTDIEVVSKPYCVLPVDNNSKEAKSHKVDVFTMKEIPALRDEPYISCDDDYLQRVESDVIAVNVSGRRIDLTENWASIVNSLMKDEDFGVQLTKNIPRTDDLDASLKKLSDPYQKMLTIFRYVRSNMQWNGHSNIWALNGVKTAWKEKKGTSGEINLILINLLKDAGLDAYPVLVSTRENGRVNPLNPSYGQFDEVMAYVQIGEHIYVLDATDKYASPKLIPLPVMFTEGLLIERFDSFKWGWVPLWDEKQVFNNFISINATIDAQGVMSGYATVNSYDYSRAVRMPDLKNGKDKFVEKYFTSAIPNLQVDSFSVDNEDVDTLPLVQAVKFRQNISSSGDYKYFTTNLFTGLEKNPFTSENRFSDVYFGANQKYTIVESFFIPEGYVYDELPKNTRMMLPDTSVVFTRIMQAEDDRLFVRTTIEFKKPYFKVDDYGNFREFYKKLFDFLNEQIVIKKKK